MKRERILLNIFIFITLVLVTGGNTYSMSSKKMEEVAPLETEVVKPKLEEKPVDLEIEEVADKRDKDIDEKPFERLEVKLSKENVAGLYRELLEQDNGMRNYIKSDEGIYNGYTEEIIGVKWKGIKSVRLVSAPYASKYNILVEKNMLYFKSLYQGDYEFQVEDRSSKIINISIKIRHKYSFTEGQNYDIILDSYNEKEYSILESASNLYIISFPNSFKIKDIYIMKSILLQEEGRLDESRNEIEKIRNNFVLSSGEDSYISSLEEKTYKKDSPQYEEFLYSKFYLEEIGDKLIDYLSKKEPLTTKDVDFLESRYNTNEKLKVANILGNYYYKEKNYHRALTYYQKTDNNEALVKIYLLLGEDKLFEESLFKLPVAKRPYYIEAKDKLILRKKVAREFNLGVSRYNDGNYQEAILFFKRAYSRDEKYTKLLGGDIYLGRSYYNFGDYNNSIKHFNMALERDKNTPKDIVTIRYDLAMCYYKKKDYDKSLELLEEITRDFPTTSWAKKSMIYIVRLRNEKGEVEWKSTLTE